ncbi:hypothetical protein BKA63DRAFT_586196, partial [Paraphoma chrysanthemicola]
RISHAVDDPRYCLLPSDSPDILIRPGYELLPLSFPTHMQSCNYVSERALPSIDNLALPWMEAQATPTELLQVTRVKDLLENQGLNYAEPGLTQLAAVISILAQRRAPGTQAINADDLSIEMKPLQDQEIMGGVPCKELRDAMDAFANEMAMGLDYAEPGLTNLATVLSYLAQRKTTTPIITDDLLIEMKTGPFGAEFEGRPQQTGYRCLLTYHGQEIVGCVWHSKEETAMDAFATETAHLSRHLTG